MRSEEDMDTAIRALENRLQEQEGLLLAFNAPKRDVVRAIRNGDAEPGEIIDEMDQRLRGGQMELQTFIVVQASKNAAAWCAGDLDSI